MAIVLAAGAGTRLQPLTRLRPKALCPVGNVPLVDLAVGWARKVTSEVAVNVHHGRDLMEAHLCGRVHLSIEPEALGTAGALGRLRHWIAGRGVLVLNADAWHTAELGAFVDGWDGERIRLLTVKVDRGGDWADRLYAGAALMPWSEVRTLADEPSGLYEASWRRRRPGDGLELVLHEGAFFDCGTPGRYLAANLASSGGESVVGAAAVVEGELDRSVLWPGARVRAGERLSRAVRTAQGTTVLVR